MKPREIHKRGECFTIEVITTENENVSVRNGIVSKRTDNDVRKKTNTKQVKILTELQETTQKRVNKEKDTTTGVEPVAKMYAKHPSWATRGKTDE